MDKEALKQHILRQIDNDLWDAELYPHMALIPDWYDRYMQLKDKVETYLDQPCSTKPHERPPFNP